jgi:hypothetical protein
MHIRTSASDRLRASGERFGYREALAEVIIELGQATVVRHDRPRRRRSMTATARAVKQPNRRSISSRGGVMAGEPARLRPSAQQQRRGRRREELQHQQVDDENRTTDYDDSDGNDDGTDRGASA